MKKGINIMKLKKLNNRGWGMAEMIFFCAVILIALLIAAYLIYMLYQQLGLN